ncbi:MAG: DUF1684 domain-containing protein [Candidatus Eisenbacteria bacterium]
MRERKRNFASPATWVVCVAASAAIGLGATGTILAALATVVTTSTAETTENSTMEDFAAETRTWQEEREASLRSRDGWLSIAGFAWLDPGETTLGSGSEPRLPLPDESLPPIAATITVSRNDSLTYTLRADASGVVHVGDQTLAAGESVPLLSDASGSATKFTLGRVTAWVLERGGNPALRLKDPESPLFDQLQGLDFFPIDPSWVVNAKFERFAEPVQMEVPSVLGYIDTTSCYGKVVFERDGIRHAFWPMSGSADDPDLFLVFSDGTSGTATYGGGRFLVATAEEDGTVKLDFNRAYNPPCAYNPFTTCPLPPKQNEVEFPIEAGEKVPKMAEAVRH